VTKAKKSDNRVSISDEVKILLKVMAVKAQLSMSEFLSHAIPALERFKRINGHHLYEDSLYCSAAPPIAQILAAINLGALAQEIKLPVEKLQAIVAGDRPSDSDLSFLVAADCIPYTIEQLHCSRELQFDLPQGEKDVAK
jgi:hypothetical protein